MLVTLNKGYKFKIKPNNEQKEFFLKSFGCSRKVYNLYVEELYEYLENSNYQNGLIKDFKIISPAFLWSKPSKKFSTE